LELLRTLEARYGDRPVGKFLTGLRAEFVWERQRLKKLAARFPQKAPLARRVAAWFGETGFEWKLAMDAGTDADFRLFESLEALSLGIAGKRLLWKALELRSKAEPLLGGVPYRKLANRAARQRRELEPFRLEAARLAFGQAPGVVDPSGKDRALSVGS
jgi:hypothetical protein